jgi:hypothetical protein
MTKEIPCSCSCKALLTCEDAIDKDDKVLEIMIYPGHKDGEIRSIVLNKNAIRELRDHLNKVLEKD